MSRCERCNLEVKGDKYCPLCGKFVKQTNLQEKEYPANVKYFTNTSYVLRVIFGFLILLNILCGTLELIVTKNFYYTWHLIVPSLLAVVSIYFPLKKNWSFLAVCSICFFTISGYIIFLENFTNTFGWGVTYAVPLFLLASEIALFLFFAIGGFERVEVFMPILICLILSLGIFLYNYLKKFVYWPSASCLLFGFACLFIIYIVKSRRTKKNLQKSFHI